MRYITLLLWRKRQRSLVAARLKRDPMHIDQVACRFLLVVFGFITLISAIAVIAAIIGKAS